MQIGQLIADFSFAQARLKAAILGQSSTRVQAELVREAAALMDAIERHAPETESELREQVQFFMMRAGRAKRSITRERDTEIALGLLNKHSDQFRNMAPPCKPVATDRRDLPLLSEQRVSSYVVHSTERLAAVDSSYRYLATSRPNADFNRRNQSAMIGLHVVEMIGLSRFNARARQRLDRCFAGEVQEYYYDLTDPERGRRFIRCQMKPVHDEVGQRYCSLMYMTDVTGLAFERL